MNYPSFINFPYVHPFSLVSLSGPPFFFYNKMLYVTPSFISFIYTFLVYSISVRNMSYITHKIIYNEINCRA